MRHIAIQNTSDNWVYNSYPLLDFGPDNVAVVEESFGLKLIQNFPEIVQYHDADWVSTNNSSFLILKDVSYPKVDFDLIAGQTSTVSATAEPVEVESVPAETTSVEPNPTEELQVAEPTVATEQ